MAKHEEFDPTDLSAVPAIGANPSPTPARGKDDANDATTEAANKAGLLDGLTPEQRSAVEHTEGPLLILAAAGSGKTRVITRRIAYLLSIGVPPWQILALTFTNKAAGEMRERVVALLEHADNAGQVLSYRDDGSAYLRGLTISTFHSLCARLLRRYADIARSRVDLGVKGDYTIYDSGDQNALIKRVIKGLDLSTSNWSPASVRAQISNAKNEMLTAEAFEEQAWDFNTRMTARIYKAYQEALRTANAVDFDDLMLLTVRMLEGCAEVRDEVNDRWRYLMIDEYQDTNRVQFRLSELLVGTEPGRPPNVCVVGDPDQSIYGWRGADISNILSFEERFAGAATIALGRNFRSTRHILGAADGLIKHNTRRKDKPLFTDTEGGEKPMVVQCRSEHHEAELVGDWVKMLVEGPSAVATRVEGEADGGESLVDPDLVGTLEYKDIAVMYRNNALSRVMEDTLRRAGVPYVIARGTAFYEREEVKDTLAYLRVVANPADGVSLSRIINKPARKIGKKSIDELDAFAQRQGLTLFEACRCVREVDGVSSIAAKAVEKFTETVDAWNGSGSFMGQDVPGGLSELVERVVRESGLEAHYTAKAAKGDSEKDEDKVANLEELISSAAEFEDEFDPANDPAFAIDPEDAERDSLDAPTPDMPPLLAVLRAYLESVALVADADKVDPARGAVTLMTLHAAKGLEFPAVAVIGLEEGLLPGMRAFESDEELEEERRLTFVGITRAMRTLVLSSARYRTHRGMRERTIPSRFLSELPKEHIAFLDWSTDEWDPDTFGGNNTDDDLGDGWGGGDFEFDQRPPSERKAAAAKQRSRNKFGPAGVGKGGRGSGLGTQIEAGSMVKHPQFGVGTVEKVQGRGAMTRATIDFEDLGRKTLVVQYARLTPMPNDTTTDEDDEPAPF